MPARPNDTPEDFTRGGQPQVVRIPILLYHHILADTPPVRYSVAVHSCEQQLDCLREHDYHTITMQELVSAIRTGAASSYRADATRAGRSRARVNTTDALNPD